MQFATFESKCHSCGSVFAAPITGDFDYGSAILTRACGTVYAYHNFVGCQVWDFISLVLPYSDGETRGELVARVADMVGGLPFTNRVVCPVCKSNDRASWVGKRVGYVDVTKATFGRFFALETAEREKWILEILPDVTR